MSVTLRTFKARKPLNECFRLLLYQFHLFQKVLNIPFFFSFEHENITRYQMQTSMVIFIPINVMYTGDDAGVFKQFTNLKLHIVWNILFNDITKQGRNNNEHLMSTLNSSQKKSDYEHHIIKRTNAPWNLNTTQSPHYVINCIRVCKKINLLVPIITR